MTIPYYMELMGVDRPDRTHGSYVTYETFTPKTSCTGKSFGKCLKIVYLVGGFNPFEKYESQNGNLPPIRGENKKRLKPPPSLYIWIKFDSTEKKWVP